MRRPYNVFNLPTTKKAIKAFVSDEKVYVVVNEKIYHGSETYLLTFDAKELIEWKLKKIYEAMR